MRLLSSLGQVFDTFHGYWDRDQCYVQVGTSENSCVPQSPNTTTSQPHTYPASLDFQCRRAVRPHSSSSYLPWPLLHGPTHPAPLPRHLDLRLRQSAKAFAGASPYERLSSESGFSMLRVRIDTSGHESCTVSALGWESEDRRFAVDDGGG